MENKNLAQYRGRDLRNESQICYIFTEIFHCITVSKWLINMTLTLNRNVSKCPVLNKIIFLSSKRLDFRHVNK